MLFGKLPLRQADCLSDVDSLLVGFAGISLCVGSLF